MSELDKRIEKPLGIKIIAGIDFLIGGLWIVIFLSFLPMNVQFLNGPAPTRALLGLLFMLVLAIVGVVYIVGGIGLYKLKPYGRILNYIFYGLSALIIVKKFVVGIVDIASIVKFVLCLLVIYYLSTESVRQLFKRET